VEGERREEEETMRQTNGTNGHHAMNGHATSPWTDWASSFAHSGSNGRQGADGRTARADGRSAQPAGTSRAATRDAADALMDCYNG
jgi:hypothetical protein